MATVNELQLVDYIKTYLDTFLYEIEKLPQEQQLLFEFHKEQPMDCRGFISDNHGCAVAFLPSEKPLISIRRTTSPIESIFPKEPWSGDTLLQAQIVPGMTYHHRYTIHANLELRKSHLLQEKNEVAKLDKGVTMSLDEQSTFIIRDRLILKGTNAYEAWTREQAVRDVFNEIVRCLVNKEKKGEISENPLESFDKIITAFRTMVESEGTSEPQLQSFFEENPAFLLQGRMYRKLHPRVILQSPNGDLIPDFLLERTSDGFCDILDLKLPDKQIIVGPENRKKFSSHVESAIAQVDEYGEFFNDQKNTNKIKLIFNTFKN